MLTGYRHLLTLTTTLLAAPGYVTDAPAASNAQMKAIIEELRHIRRGAET